MTQLKDDIGALFEETDILWNEFHEQFDALEDDIVDENILKNLNNSVATLMEKIESFVELVGLLEAE